MGRYQIRNTDSLEDINTEMAEQGWKTLKTWGALNSSSEEEFSNFRKSIRDAMVNYDFDDDFVLGLTSKSILSIEHILNQDHEAEACTMLGAIFRLVLAKYLYVDPACSIAVQKDMQLLEV